MRTIEPRVELFRGNFTNSLSREEFNERAKNGEYFVESHPISKELVWKQMMQTIAQIMVAEADPAAQFYPDYFVEEPSEENDFNWVLYLLLKPVEDMV